MSFKIRTDFSSITTIMGKNNFIPPTKIQVGKVFGIVTTENTPTEKQFKRAGGFNGIGTIFYLDYDKSKYITGSVSDTFLDSCELAVPASSQIQHYPLLQELVQLHDYPASANQSTNNTTGLKYYTSAINLYNNQQQNSQPANNKDTLGAGFIENSNIKPLLAFVGDYIVQGRQGNAIRFGTTNPFRNINEWSSVGRNNDPILILTNGFGPSDKGLKYYVEKINKDQSSIYLTSAQKIPLQTDKKGVLNNITNPLNVPDYLNSQIILNSDRIVLNSKKDELMLFAKTNIELNTKNVINLNADGRVHLNSNNIVIGLYDTNNSPQPLMLGFSSVLFLQKLVIALGDLSESLMKMVSAKEGAPILEANAAGKALSDDLKELIDSLEDLLSKKVFIT